MQALSRREETEVVEKAKKEALKVCDDYVREFAECATGRTFSMAWACKTQFNTWTQCMREYVTEDRLNTMKLDYIAHRSERGQEAIEELRRKGDENFRRMGGKKVEVGA